MAQPSVASGQGGSHGPRTDGIPGYSPPTFHVTTNEAGCGDGHGNAIVLPEGVHSMEDKKGVLHFFDLSGDAWQDDETTAFDCRQGRPEVDDLLNGLFPYVTSHVYGSGSDKDSFIRCHPNYGTNEKHPSGVPPGKYQELMHSVLYKRALRQSQYAVIQTMRQQLEDYRRQVKNMRDEMVMKGMHADHWDEHHSGIGGSNDIGWVDAQAQIDKWVIYFVIIYSCHVISYHLISFNMMCQVDREQVKQRIVDIPRCPGPDPNPNP